MQDRVPLYPGRVKLTPVSGQENTYDMVRADEPTQEGTPLNKATLLKDTTATLYGLGTYAVPDNALAFIGKYNQHWWKRTSTETRSEYQEKQDLVTTNMTVVPVHETRTIQYSAEISIDQSTGAISLVSPKYLAVDYHAQKPPSFPVYFQNISSSPDSVFYAKDDGTALFRSTGESDSHVWIMANRCYEVTADLVEIPIGGTDYVQSYARDTYPDGGTQGGYEYEYLGVPFDNAVNACKIVTGSYAGTGTYGSGNPNSLTFDFKPKIVWIYAFTSVSASTLLRTVESGGSNVIPFDIIPNTYTKYFGFYYSGGSDNAYGKRDGNTLYWYNNSAYYQMNNTNWTYYYIAIG